MKKDVDGVFNAEPGGAKWRAIKIFQGDKVNARGLKKVLLAAVALNAAGGKGRARRAGAAGKASKRARTAATRLGADRGSRSKR